MQKQLITIPGYRVYEYLLVINPHEELRLKILCDALREEGLKLLNWGEAQEEWQARVLSLRNWRPDEGWPDVSNEA